MSRDLAGEWPECETVEVLERRARARAAVADLVGFTLTIAAFAALVPLALIIAPLVGTA